MTATTPDATASMPRRKTDEELEKIVFQIVIDELTLPDEMVKKEADFIKDLKCDDLDVVQVITATEGKFGIVIHDAEGEAIDTVDDLIKVIRTKGV